MTLSERHSGTTLYRQQEGNVGFYFYLFFYFSGSFMSTLPSSRPQPVMKRIQNRSENKHTTLLVSQFFFFCSGGAQGLSSKVLKWTWSQMLVWLKQQWGQITRCDSRDDLQRPVNTNKSSCYQCMVTSLTCMFGFLCELHFVGCLELVWRL